MKPVVPLALTSSVPLRAAVTPIRAYDVNGDGRIDKNDTVDVNGVPIFPQWHPDLKIIYDLLIISGEAYRQDAQGNIEQFDTIENMPGMFFWRVIGQ